MKKLKNKENKMKPDKYLHFQHALRKNLREERSQPLKIVFSVIPFSSSELTNTEFLPKTQRTEDIKDTINLIFLANLQIRIEGDVGFLILVRKEILERVLGEDDYIESFL